MIELTKVRTRSLDILRQVIAVETFDIFLLVGYVLSTFTFGVDSIRLAHPPPINNTGEHEQSVEDSFRIARGIPGMSERLTFLVYEKTRRSALISQRTHIYGSNICFKHIHVKVFDEYSKLRNCRCSELAVIYIGRFAARLHVDKEAQLIECKKSNITKK